MSQKSLEDLNMCAVPEPSWCSKSTRTLFKAGECAKSYLLNRQGQGARHWASCSKYAYMYTSGLTQVETKVWKKYWRLIFWNLSGHFFFLKVWAYFELGNFYCTYSWFNSYFFLPQTLGIHKRCTFEFWVGTLECHTVLWLVNRTNTIVKWNDKTMIALLKLF